MWRLFFFLVYVFVSTEDENETVTQDWNAVTMEDVEWTAGSAVKVTLGPEDAVYCRLKDNKGTNVFDGFGPCRVVLDRVTKEHRGYWELFAGTPGTVLTRNRWYYVAVVAAVDPTPVVTMEYAEKDDRGLFLTCSVPEEYQVQSCTFRNPSHTVFIATPRRSLDGQGKYKDIYASYAEHNMCKLVIMAFRMELTGMWRCAVNTTWGTSHGFVKVPLPKEDELHDYNYDGFVPTKINLKTKYNGIPSTEGNAVTMSCSIDAAVRYCYFRAPNGTIFNVGPSTSSAGYEYVGNGFNAGECGIRFNNIWKSAQGQWSCNVGLTNTSYLEEKRDFFSVYVNERFMVHHRWEGNSVVIRLRIATGPKLEYCRCVRSDGLGFVFEQAPHPYEFDMNQPYGTCTLYIPRPVAEDLRPWTVVARLIGENEELSVTTTLDPQSTRKLSRTASALLWSLFGTLFVFLIVASYFPKKTRQWIYQRAVRIRKSFRRQLQPQP